LGAILVAVPLAPDAEALTRHEVRPGVLALNPGGDPFD
jgi:hypothetical protein